MSVGKLHGLAAAIQVNEVKNNTLTAHTNEAEVGTYHGDLHMLGSVNVPCQVCSPVYLLVGRWVYCKEVADFLSAPLLTNSLHSPH